MNTLTKWLLGGLALASLLSALTAQTEETPKERLKRLQAQEEALYQRMAKEGISHELVEAIGTRASVEPRTGGKISEYGKYNEILADKVLKPGEHYRFELDEFILTMVVPDATPGSSWIVPYADTRSDPRRDQVMRDSKTGLQVANLRWFYDSLFSGWSTNSIMGINIYYDAVLPPGGDVPDLSTPEKLRDFSSKILYSRVPSQVKIDEAKRDGDILNSAGNRVYLDTETTVINGRVWTRQAMNGRYDRLYKYKTVLSADRMLAISISMVNFDFNANPDFTAYPRSLKRAFAQMDEMVASLRVAKRNDDGTPDPFVIERVEPAPLPVRERPPTNAFEERNKIIGD
jgi:hypothetical protein